ncbi:MAG: hypothetical protein ABI165_01640 [Bryobacteraceae bacterium]
MVRLQIVWLLLVVSTTAWAADHWSEFRSGPFQIVTDAGAKTARARLNQLEQLRNALGRLIGKTDPQLVWPIRLVLLRTSEEYGSYALPQSFVLGRDAWLSAWPAGTPLNREWLRDCVQLFLDANTGRMPAPIERGLRDLFATLTAEGIRVTLGAPLPPDERNPDWALLQMLATNPESAGRLPVFIANLAHGGDVDSAAHNAFDQSGAEVLKQAAAYLAAGQFRTIEVSARAVDEVRDFPERPWDRTDAALLLADLLAANPAHYPEAGTAYGALKSPEADAGLGLLDAREKKSDEARLRLTAATTGGSRSAPAWLEFAALQTDRAKIQAALEKSVTLNPHWAEPHVRLSQLASDAAGKIPELKAAAKLEPRNAALWQTFAETALAADQFDEAAKAWSGAERAAATPGEQARVRQARIDLEQKRADYEEAERRRIADEKARDLERVRQQAMDQVQQAIDSANRALAGNGNSPAPAKVVPWWDGAHGARKLDGILQRVDCLGSMARLVIKAGNGPVTRLIVRNPAQVEINGAGDHGLACGAARAHRRIHVEYNDKPDAKLGVAGDVVMVEFP